MIDPPFEASRGTAGRHTVPVSCNRDCGAGCPLLAHLEDGRLVRITHNPLGSPHMRGCLRGLRMAEVLYSPQRLLRPLERSGPRGSGAFREIGWPEALAKVADRLEALRERHSCDSLLRLGGSGSCRGALHHTGRLAARFLTLWGGFTDTGGNYSSQAADFVLPYLFGTRWAGLDAATLQFSNLILLWGANVSDTRFGCELESCIRARRRQGVPVIALDPRRSRTVERLADEWIPVLPGTDSALMAAVLHVLLTEGLVDRPFIRRTSRGFEELERTILGLADGRPKSPDWAEPICGVPAERIARLARLYGRRRPAALLPGLSIQRTLGGEEAVRMAVSLQVATGNVGVPGGSTGANIWNRLPPPRCGSIGVPAPPAPSPAAAAPSVPVYRWADAVLGEEAGGRPAGPHPENRPEIRAIYSVGGNYLVQGADLRKSIRAFSRVELAVCHDYFLTPTARWCDFVLPAVTFLEREDIVFPGTNHLLYSGQAVAPVGEARTDYAIFCGLAERLGFADSFSEGRSAAQWLDRFLAESEVEDVERFRRTGIWFGKEQFRVGLADFVRDPDGSPLATPSGRIEIASAAYARTGFPAAPRPFPPDPADPDDPRGEYPLRLVTPHARYRINSQNANLPGFARREEQRLWMNPTDARRLGIGDGDPARVENDRGRVVVAVRVTEDIRPGVVCLPAGAWPALDGEGTDTAGSANLLTSTTPTEPSQGSRTHSVRVRVERAAAARRGASPA